MAASHYHPRGICHARPRRVPCPVCGELIAAPNLPAHQRGNTCARVRAAKERDQRFAHLEPTFPGGSPR